MNKFHLFNKGSVVINTYTLLYFYRLIHVRYEIFTLISVVESIAP